MSKAVCDPIVIQGVTEEFWASIKDKALTHQIAISGESGLEHFGGEDFTWVHDPVASTLTVQCVRKPLFVPCSLINKKIAELFKT